MLTPFVPKRSGVHRLAAIALFRALLTQCRQSPLDSETKSSILNIVRNRFKSNRHVCSKNMLSVAFRGGYEAIDLLDTATAGDAESVSNIQSFLRTVPDRLKQPTKPSPLLREKETPARPPWPPLTRGPYTTIFQRPYPKVSGIRRVPTLVITSGIPFLRIKKPQPETLTGILKRRIRQYQARTDLFQALRDTALPIAAWEDDWDRIIDEEFGDVLREEAGPGTDEADQPPWTAAVTVSGVEYLKMAMRLTAAKNFAAAMRMWEIVKKERVLAEAEEMERKREREAVEGTDAKVEDLAGKFKKAYFTSDSDATDTRLEDSV